MSDWLHRAMQAADAQPLRPRSTLFLAFGGAARRIGSIEPAVASLLLEAGGMLDRHGDGFCVPAPADASFATIAAWLRDRRLAGPWRDELLSVVDDEGHVLGSIERAAVRVLGLRTFAVHLVGRADDGHVWVQQRAFDKSTDPGLWDTLMGGQVAAGESTLTTLERETMEEAGLLLSDLRDLEAGEAVVVRRPVAEGYMVERIDVFRARLPGYVVPINRDGEVERFECIDGATLRERLEDGAFTLEASLILAAELARAAGSLPG